MLSVGLLFQKKKTNKGGLGHTSLNIPPGIFHFFTLPLEIGDKTNFHPWKLHKVVLDPFWKFQSQKQKPIPLKFHTTYFWHYYYTFLPPQG